MNPLIRGAAALLLTTMIAMPASADVPGFFLGADLSSSHIGRDDAAPDEALLIEENGGGLGLHLGWAFGPSFPVRLNLMGARHETTDADVDLDYSSVTLEGMYLFRNPAPLRPYLMGGVGGFQARARQDALDFEVNGPGVVFGGGLHYYFTPSFSMEFGGRLEFINWEESRATLSTPSGNVTVEGPIEDEGSAAKLLLGVSWWP